MSCTLKMGAVYSFELFIHFYQTTWQLNLVDSVQCTGCWVYLYVAFQEYEMDTLFFMMKGSSYGFEYIKTNYNWS